MQTFRLHRITTFLTEKYDLSHQSYRHWVTDVWVDVKSSKPYKNMRVEQFALGAMRGEN